MMKQVNFFVIKAVSLTHWPLSSVLNWTTLLKYAAVRWSRRYKAPSGLSIDCEGRLLMSFAANVLSSLIVQCIHVINSFVLIIAYQQQTSKNVVLTVAF